MSRRVLAGFILAALLFTGYSPPSSGTTPVKPLALPVDLTQLLAPPPPQDSNVTKDEIQEILSFQKERTKAMEAAAIADQEKSVFRFADVLGEKFTPENLPLTSALFDKAVKAAKGVADPAKIFFNRPRPYVQDKAVKPCCKLEENPSYPSGHATAGTVMAILLANMVPEKRTEIFARGWKFALNRVIGGVHYHSDIEAGRVSGTVIAAALMRDKKFMAEFGKANEELRSVLGLSDGSN